MRFGCAALALLSLAAIIVLGPNLIWLASSTARVENRTSRGLAGVRLQTGQQDVVIGSVPSGDSRFVFLPVRGESTLQVHYSFNGEDRTGCQEYVEQSMYHVEAVIDADGEIACRTSLALTGRLLLSEAF